MGTIKKWLFMNAPNLDTYHPPEYDGYPEPTCQFVAEKFDLAVLGGWIEWNDYPTIIKNINPAVKLLNYRWIHSAGPPGAGGMIPEICSWDDIKFDEDYFLHHAATGERIRCGSGENAISLTDPSSSKWRDCFIARMQNDLDDPLYGQPFDGWHIDEPLTAAWLLMNTGCSSGWGISPNDPIVLPPEGAPDCSGMSMAECMNTDGCYWNGSKCVTMTWYDLQQQDMFHELKQAFPTKLVSPNVREHLYAETAKAHEYEGPIHTYFYGWNVWHPNYSPGICYNQISQLENLTNRGIHVRWGSGARIAQPPSQEELTRLTFIVKSCLGAYLMGMRPNYSMFGFNYQRYKPHYGYHPEMDIGIGNPKAPYEALEYEGGYPTLYAREFDSGWVLVNLSHTTTYETEIDGTIFTLTPGEAYFPPSNGETPSISWLLPVAIAGAGATIGMAYLYKMGYLKKIIS